MCSDGSAKSKEHARVSKDEDGVGLCGVSRRTNLWLWETIAARAPLFRIVIYNEWRNSNV